MANILTQTEEADFGRWYRNYPNKKSVGDAKKAWKALSPDTDLQQKMINALLEQKKWRSQKHNKGDFIAPWKLPATWLRQTCWEDYLEFDDEPEKVETKKCQCGNESHFGKVGICVECYTKQHAGQELLRAKAVSLGFKRGDGREKSLEVLKREGLLTFAERITGKVLE